MRQDLRTYAITFRPADPRFQPAALAGRAFVTPPPAEEIQEALREESDLPLGAWQRHRKVADWPLAIRLISESLATRCKDLQLAVWLAEAMLRQEGPSGLREALDLIRNLIEMFWEGLYPALEDGNAELRAVPLCWLGRTDRILTALQLLPVTQGGLTVWQYRADLEDGKRGRQAYPGGIREGLRCHSSDVLCGPPRDTGWSAGIAEPALPGMRPAIWWSEPFVPLVAG